MATHARTVAQDVVRRAHVVGTMPLPTKVVWVHNRGGGEMRIHVVCPDGELGYGTANAARSTPFEAAVALLEDLGTVRLTIEDGRIMEVARATMTMQAADMAVLAAAGVDRTRIERWGRPQTVWTNPVYSASTRVPDIRGLSWRLGCPELVKLWPGDDGTPITYRNGMVIAPAMPDTILAAMTGEPLDRFVELDGLAGLGLVIKEASIGRMIDKNGCLGAPRSYISLAGGQVEMTL